MRERGRGCSIAQPSSVELNSLPSCTVTSDWKLRGKTSVGAAIASVPCGAGGGGSNQHHNTSWREGGGKEGVDSTSAIWMSRRTTSEDTASLAFSESRCTLAGRLAAYDQEEMSTRAAVTQPRLNLRGGRGT